MTRVFVEGREADFIEVYLNFLFGKNEGRWEIINTKGYTNLHLVDQQFKENTEAGGTNLIIFDADYPENGGGFQKRKSEIEYRLSQLSIVSDIFLFPDNRSDGDFELLLENIVNAENKCLLKCFEAYEACISQYKDFDGNNKYISPNRKAKIYAYVESIKKTKGDKEKFKNQKSFFYDNSEYWNLSSEYLSPLETILRRTVI